MHDQDHKAPFRSLLQVARRPPTARLHLHLHQNHAAERERSGKAHKDLPRGEVRPEQRAIRACPATAQKAPERQLPED